MNVLVHLFVAVCNIPLHQLRFH